MIILAPLTFVSKENILFLVCANLYLIFMFPFMSLYPLYPFYIFSIFVVDKGVYLAPTYSSIVVRKSDLRSSSRTKRWLSCFCLFCKICFHWTKGHLRCWTIKRSFDFERRETLRRWTFNDLMGLTKEGLLLLRILNCDEEIRPT